MFYAFTTRHYLFTSASAPGSIMYVNKAYSCFHTTTDVVCVVCGGGFLDAGTLVSSFTFCTQHVHNLSISLFVYSDFGVNNLVGL